MKLKLFAVLLACCLLLSACQYIVVEDGKTTQAGLIRFAFAESAEEGHESEAPQEETPQQTEAPKKTEAPQVTEAPEATEAPRETPPPQDDVQATATPKPEKRRRSTKSPATYAPTMPAPTSAAPTSAAPTATPESVLARGSRDAEGEHAVADLQRRLIALDYLMGEADGIFGGGTERALTAFQAQNGLKETGEADRSTLRKLNSSLAIPMPTPSPTPLAKGAQGDDVKAIQQALKQYGFLMGSADGDFGENTDRGFRAFQSYQYEMGAFEPTPSPTPEPTSTPWPLTTPTPMPMESMMPQRGSQFDPKPDTSALEDALDESEENLPEETTPAFEPDGVVTDEFKEMLLGGGFETFREEVQRGDEGWEVLRVQYRLSDLDYHWDSVDGRFGKNTEESLKYFQKLNKLEETGIADEATQRLLFSENAIKSDKPKYLYQLKVSVKDQRVYAYKWANGSYSQLVRTMICSTGTQSNPTPLGSFRADGPAGRWYYFQKYQCWAQYAYRIDGPILFHSVIYSQKDTSTVRKSSVNNLGSRASHGCVRLKVEDAQWIFNNCPAGTLVTVY